MLLQMAKFHLESDGQVWKGGDGGGAGIPKGCWDLGITRGPLLPVVVTLEARS